MTGPDSSPENEFDSVQATAGGPGRLAGLEPLASELFAASGATRFDLTIELFKAVLAEVADKYLPPEADAAALRQLLGGIHVEELVLARACASGNQAAWDTFLVRYRESLYEAGIAIAKDYGQGRELADSLYADLWGSADRPSPLSSYMGYGSLAGYLRTIMGRAFIDRYRSERRLVSLEEETENGWQLPAPEPQPMVAAEPRLEEATDEALRGLDAEDRFILASFFLHDRTLADLSKVLRLHESTVSRRISKIVASLRKQILRGMTRRGMSRRQAEEALQADVRDLHINVRARLQENLQESPVPPSSEQGAKAAKVKNDV